MYKNEEIELFHTTDEYKLRQVCSILTENNIPFIRRDEGSGSYINLYMGNSIQTKRVFINKEDSENAKKLLSFLNVDVIPKEKTSENKNKINRKNTSINKYIIIRRTFGFIILCIPILIILLVIIFSLQ